MEITQKQAQAIGLICEAWILNHVRVDDNGDGSLSVINPLTTRSVIVEENGYVPAIAVAKAGKP